MAAVLGFIYIARTLPLDTKPFYHGLTMVSIGASWIMMILLFAKLLSYAGV